MRIDLHMHTTVSDGGRPIADQAAICGQRRLALWAITDHDSCAAWPQIADLPGVLCGVEATAWAAAREVHIVGLGIDPDQVALVSLLRSIRAARWHRMIQLTDWLRSKQRGWDLVPDRLRADGATDVDSVVTRSHLGDGDGPERPCAACPGRLR